MNAHGGTSRLSAESDTIEPTVERISDTSHHATATTLTILLFSLEPWDTVWRRNQYVVDGLLRHDDSIRVLFIEPPADVVHDALTGRRPRRGAGVRSAPGYGGRLTLMQPTKVLPRILGPLADRMLRRSVRRAVQRTGSHPSLLWINDPRWAAMLAEFSAPSLYDMTDDWLAARRSEREHDRLVRDEASLMDACGAVVVCSVGLAASRRETRPDLVTIPNAVDVERYRTPMLRPTDLPEARCAVYVGTLHEDRLDVDLVVRTGAAVSATGGTCVLIGPNALSPENTQRLALAPGVLMLGVRPYEAIPAYLQHADVLIVPHAVTTFTDSLDPIKLYEYRSVARPVVSTPVAGFRENERPGALDIAMSLDFPGTVARALRRTPAPVNPEDVPDWRCRIRQFEAVLDRLATRHDAHLAHSTPLQHDNARSDGNP